MPPTIATNVSWTEKIEALEDEALDDVPVEEGEVEVHSVSSVPLADHPGHLDAPLDHAATRLTANAEMKYRNVTAR